jgi:protein-S-isoprenylcysteine O-methyltransferase Ste14
VKPPSRRKSLAPRLFPLYGLALVLLWMSHPTAAGLAAGFVLVGAGEALRLWAAGYLVKNDELTLSGPYAHVRNPLYLGSLLVGCGFLLMGGRAASLWLLPIGLAFFFLYYFPYKERIESARLERFYGEPYRAYRAAVPALFPRITPWRSASVRSALRWSRERMRANHEHGAALAIALGAVALLLRPLVPL